MHRHRPVCHNRHRSPACACRVTDANDIRNGELLAAVDIGSNSFHMIVARYEHGELRVIDRLRDSVRLAMGLGADGSLAAPQRERALACLAQFGQRLRGLAHGRVHAVATNAVRQLANPQAFLMPAETALGHPIEIVSGREEARLIYLGVANGLPRGDQRRLVVDIGGGSTEFIIGQDFEALERESVQIGCVASTRRFFEDGKLTAKRWRQASTEIAVELQQFAADYRSRGWAEAFGSSGTVRAIGGIVHANRWSDSGITAESIARLRDTLIAAGSIQGLELPGLSEERAQVIAGGVVILEAVFAALGVEQMGVCETSMREGLLYDMLGRAMQRDPRAGAIAALVERYAVDRSQAGRVHETAWRLFDQVAAAWHLEPIDRDVLGWCADIHEIGLAIAHSQHHLHGAYIVAHSDLAGFSQQGQQLLETILRSHRRRPQRSAFEALPERLRTIARRLTALLRLAVLLHRGRTSEPLPPLSLHAGARALRLDLPALWLDQHPLTRADLEQECDYFKPLGLKLEIGTR